MRRITILITGLGHGGAERQALQLAAGLARRGWRVRLISLLPLPGDIAVRCPSGVEAESLGLRRGIPHPKGLVLLVRTLSRHRPDVLLTFMYHANVIGRVVGAVMRIPVIASIRTPNFGGRARMWAERLTEPMGRATTVNSARVAESLISRNIVRRDRLEVIPNGVDILAYASPPADPVRTRTEIGGSDGVFLWAIVGRLEPAKDHATLLRAFAGLQDERCVLAVVGQGPLADDLRSLAGELGLLNRVRFLGLRRDVPQVLHATDALVLSSAWEGMPNVVMEAMAAGRPVVATAVGGVPELVREGETGFIVPPGDPVLLASAMDRMMRLPKERRAEFGERGRRVISEEFDLERVVDRWERLLLRACEHGQ